MNSNDIWGEFVPVIGKKLYRLAVRLSRLPDEPFKKTVAKEALAVKGRKRLSKAATVEGVFNAQRAMRERRRLRHVHPGGRRVNRPVVWKFAQKRAKFLEVVGRCNGAPSLASRLRDLKAKRFDTAVDQAMLTGPRGHDHFHWVDDPKAVGVSVDTWTEWEKVWRSTYPRNHTRRDFYIPRFWGTRVFKRGLAVVDGLLTLDAAEVSSPVEGIEVFAATWVERARGYHVCTGMGFIARSAVYAYHGSTLEKAVAGLKRKQRIAQMDPAVKEARAQKRREVRARQLADECGEVWMTVADSIEVGNCDYGTRSWCHAVGIDPDEGATLARVVDGYLQRPQPEAWQVLAHVARARC